MKIYLERTEFNRGVDVRIVAQGELAMSIAKPLQFDELPPDHYAPPTFKMNMDEAQNMIDELWRCGLRPTEGTGSAGALAATQNHLNDMRKLLFNKEGLLIGQ